MIGQREAIYAALLAKAATITWSTRPSGWAMPPSRRVQLFTDIQEQPALFQAENGETVMEPGRGIPAKVFLEARWIIYSKVGEDPKIIPAMELNLILDAIEKALAPDTPMANAQTLGGLVSWCRVEGKIIKDPGDIDGQGLLIVPLKMLVP